MKDKYYIIREKLWDLIWEYRLDKIYYFLLRPFGIKSHEEELFEAYDYTDHYGEYRIINGKPCVYWTEGWWISKDGVELSERDDEKD